MVFVNIIILLKKLFVSLIFSIFLIYYYYFFALQYCIGFFLYFIYFHSEV